MVEELVMYESLVLFFHKIIMIKKVDKSTEPDMFLISSRRVRESDSP